MYPLRAQEHGQIFGNPIFYHIAKGANVPILPTFLDYGNKRGGFGIPIITTDNLLSDMQKKSHFYTPFKGKFPLNSGPVKLQK